MPLCFTILNRQSYVSKTRLAMKIMDDLKSPKLIYLKGFLFLLTGILSIIVILLENPSIHTAFMLGISIWSFCRLYYFMFYVIEKYVDAEYRFAGIHSFVIYLIRKERDRKH
jgi:hypothetical protein